MALSGPSLLQEVQGSGLGIDRTAGATPASHMELGQTSEEASPLTPPPTLRHTVRGGEAELRGSLAWLTPGEGWPPETWLSWLSSHITSYPLG